MRRFPSGGTGNQGRHSLTPLLLCPLALLDIGVEPICKDKRADSQNGSRSGEDTRHKPRRIRWW